jgi:hypothetical protein
MNDLLSDPIRVCCIRYRSFSYLTSLTKARGGRKSPKRSIKGLKVKGHIPHFSGYMA